jgi:hypothetical protein
MCSRRGVRCAHSRPILNGAPRLDLGNKWIVTRREPQDVKSTVQIISLPEFIRSIRSDLNGTGSLRPNRYARFNHGRRLPDQRSRWLRIQTVHSASNGTVSHLLPPGQPTAAHYQPRRKSPASSQRRYRHSPNPTKATDGVQRITS